MPASSRRAPFWNLFAVSLLICSAITAFSAAQAADDVKQEMTAAAAAVRPALIRILVAAVDYDQGRQMKTESAGSGVIISPEGYAVTNHHVAMNAQHIVCTLSDKREVDAKLVGTDALADIAVIKLVSPDKKPFPCASFGNSSVLEVGDRVFAMGCPLALSQSVTMGIVSNVEMMMPEDFSSGEMTLEGEDVGSIVKWIGHDALIEPGNSGGPLVSRDGKIVGINEISFGLAGAIPSNLVKSIADQLIKYGVVKRSWIGVETQPLLRTSKTKKGVLVASVLAGSPAAKGGLKPGDIILGLDGVETIAVFKEQIPQFNQLVANIPIGKVVTAKVLRNGSPINLTITTVERPKATDKQIELKTWGMCGSNITSVMQKEMQLSSSDGVIVSGVLPSGPAGAAQPPLKEEDVIVKVNDEPIKNIAQLRSVTEKILDGKTERVPVLVGFNRKEKRYITVVKVGKEETSEPGAEISKAWLGVDTQVLTSELAKALGLSGKSGVRITQVYVKSNAEKAGLKVGDLIVKLDGEVIPADQLGDEEVLPSLIRQYDIGSTVDLGVIRDGKGSSMKVKLEAAPKPSRDYPRYENLEVEFTARDIAFSDKASGEVEEGQVGAYVESVAEGSSAALGGLHAGDLITGIDTAPVNRLDDLKKAMEKIAKAKPQVVVMAVRRGIRTRFLEIKPGWTESDQP